MSYIRDFMVIDMLSGTTGSHGWGYYSVTYSLIFVKALQLIWRSGTHRFQMSLLWLEWKIGHQDSSSVDGHQSKIVDPALIQEASGRIISSHIGYWQVSDLN